MKNNYPTVVCLFLFILGLNISLVQSSGTEFLDCSSEPTSLCTTDDGVRLPANNKIYLGEENPDATSCSVQVSQKTKVRSNSSIDCSEGDPVLAGEVLTEDYQGIEKVEITLTSPGHESLIYTTGKDGKYFFNSLPSYNYSINAYRNDAPRNGVSTLDLIRIQKHLLGIEPFISPYKLIAADANNSQSVSAIDMVELRKLILGKYAELPSNMSWRFVPKNFVFQNTLHPWPFQETIMLNGLNNPVNIDFIGIKIGDVNNSVQPNAQSIQPRGSQPEIKWHADQKKYAINEVIDINFFVDDPKEIQGFQFTISDPDLEFISATSENIGLTENDYALFDDKMTLSWFNEIGSKFSNKEVVFTLKVRAKTNGNLRNSLFFNSDITQAEMYDMNDEVYVPKLLVKDQPNAIISFLPEPNPWKDKTTIPFYLNSSGKVTFEIFDFNGRSVYLKSEKYVAGNNEITLQSSDFTSRGVLFYSIQANEFIFTNKMIVLQ